MKWINHDKTIMIDTSYVKYFFLERLSNGKKTLQLSFGAQPLEYSGDEAEELHQILLKESHAQN